MPKLFSRKNKGDADDMMTISGFSMGTSSVSDRIMGRMRMSLGGISGRNLTGGDDGDADSLDGGDGSLDRSLKSAGNGSRRSLRSRPSFRRSRSLGRKLKPMPGLNSSVTRNGSNASNVVDGMMSEMDSSETMALTGRSMGRRAPSATSLRPSMYRAPSAPVMRSDPDGADMILDERFGKSRKEKQSKSQSSRHPKKKAVDQIPMEYSLSQLRQMSELELEKTLDKAGVPFEEIDEAIDKMAAVDMSIDSSTADQRKNSLVTLLINSGKVKLVRAERLHQESTRTLQTSNHSLYDNNMYKASMHDGMDESITSIPYNDETGASVQSGISVSSSTKAESRKSKLDKIYELQTDNSNIKRENKSLKKTIKKLLEQLTNITQKEKEAVALAEKYKKELESGAVQSPANESGEENGDQAADDKNNVPQTVSIRDMDTSIEKLKNELKAEKTAHKSTEFRLQVRCNIISISSNF